jgi:hypothetical protein|tara:strand:+ start:292 stop:729 length:438 start_codon:yes stop_codon:yes gene_type:complete
MILSHKIDSLANFSLSKIQKKGKQNNNDDISKQQIKSGKIKMVLRLIKRKAMRRGLWKMIDRLDTGIMNLCIYLPIKFVSRNLLRTLAKIMKTISSMLNPIHHYYEKGIDMAWRISESAYLWGNKDALKWRFDRNFAIFIGMSLK